MLHPSRISASRATAPLPILLIALGIGQAEAGGHHSRTVVVQSTPVVFSQSNLVAVQPAGHHFFHHHQGLTTALVPTSLPLSYVAPTSLQAYAVPTTLQSYAAPTTLQAVAMPPALQSTGFTLQGAPAPMTVSYLPQRPLLSPGLAASNPFETSSALLGAGDSTTNLDELLLQTDPYYQALALRLGDTARVQALKDHLRTRISRQIREDGGMVRRRNWGSFLWKIGVAFIKARFGIDLSSLDRDGATSMEKIIRDLLKEEGLPDQGEDPEPEPPSTPSARPLRSGDPVIFRGTIEYSGPGKSPGKVEPKFDEGNNPCDSAPIDQEDRGQAAPRPRQ